MPPFGPCHPRRHYRSLPPCCTPQLFITQLHFCPLDTTSVSFIEKMYILSFPPLYQSAANTAANTTANTTAFTTIKLLLLLLLPILLLLLLILLLLHKMTVIIIFCSLLQFFGVPDIRYDNEIIKE